VCIPGCGLDGTDRADVRRQLPKMYNVHLAHGRLTCRLMPIPILRQMWGGMGLRKMDACTLPNEERNPALNE